MRLYSRDQLAHLRLIQQLVDEGGIIEIDPHGLHTVNVFLPEERADICRKTESH
jgi:hypothetical protein